MAQFSCKIRLVAVLLAAASPLVVPIVHAAPEGPQRSFSGEDLFKLEGAVDPQVSPDGSKIAYVRLATDVMADKAVPSIWLVDVATGRQVPLVAGPGAHRSPRWSPDGKRIAYVSSNGASPELHVRWLDGGADSNLTVLPEAPGGIAWSPDGKSIAFAMRVPDEGLKLGKLPEKPEGAKWADGLEVIDRVTYRSRQFDPAGLDPFRPDRKVAGLGQVQQQRDQPRAGRPVGRW